MVNVLNNKRLIAKAHGSLALFGLTKGGRRLAELPPPPPATPHLLLPSSPAGSGVAEDGVRGRLPAPSLTTDDTRCKASTAGVEEEVFNGILVELTINSPADIDKEYMRIKYMKFSIQKFRLGLCCTHLQQ